MENELPKRKRLRLKDFDYSTAGSYFITICTKNRKPLFAPVGADSISARMIKRIFFEVIENYNGMSCPVYVIMPNHIHAIITLSKENEEECISDISSFVQTFKRYSTIEYIGMVKEGILPPFDKQIWQRSFYDHIIRSCDEYYEISQYIIENPLRWKYDKLYSE